MEVFKVNKEKLKKINKLLENVEFGEKLTLANR